MAPRIQKLEENLLADKHHEDLSKMIHHSATVDSSFMFTISLSDGVPYTVDGGMVL